MSTGIDCLVRIQTEVVKGLSLQAERTCQTRSDNSLALKAFNQECFPLRSCFKNSELGQTTVETEPQERWTPISKIRPVTLEISRKSCSVKSNTVPWSTSGTCPTAPRASKNLVLRARATSSCNPTALAFLGLLVLRAVPGYMVWLMRDVAKLFCHIFLILLIRHLATRP
jgi:hypothetical protein